MSNLQMFDYVTLNQHIQLHTGGIAPQGTDGAIASNWECSALNLQHSPTILKPQG